MATKKDQFWEYAEIEGDRIFSCKFCQHQFRGGVTVTRLKSHLAGVRSCNTKVCNKVPNDVQSAALQAIHAPKKKVNSTESEECAIIFGSSSSGAKEAHPSFLPNISQKDRSVVDEKLLKFILSNGFCFDLISSPSFIYFAKSLAEFGPSYALPTRSDLEVNLLIDTLDVTLYVGRVEKSLAESACCTLILDYWDDDDLRNRWINIFVCTPSGPILLKSNINTKNERLSDTLDTLKPNNVIQCFVGGAYATMFPTYANVSTTTSASHEIECLLLYICNIEWIDDIFWLAILLAKYMKHDLNMSSRREHYRSKEYANSNLTNYASRFLMLQSILKDEKELKALHAELLSTHNMDFRMYWLNTIIQCSEFWRRGQEVVEVLQPIFQVLNLVDEYWSSSGYLYEAFRRAKIKIEKCLLQNQDMFELIWIEFEDCRRKTIQPIHKAAALLNPDYELSEDLKKNEIEEGMTYILEQSVDYEERQALRLQIKSYCKTIRPSFRKKTVIITVHPRIWWERCGDSFPVLRKYAIQILSQPCSLLSCSQYRLKHICSTEHYSLGVNTMLMEKYNMMKVRDEEPIDLDKISGFPEYAGNQDLDTEYIREDEVKKLIQNGMYEKIIIRLTSLSHRGSVPPYSPLKRLRNSALLMSYTLDSSLACSRLTTCTIQ